MKLRDFEIEARAKGFELIKVSKHRIYFNGKKSLAIPNHRVINKFIARRILKEME